MTLTISVVDPGNPNANFKNWPAGFEDYRTRLWGNKEFAKLGLQLLPAIQNDLVVAKARFDELLREISTVEKRLERAKSRQIHDDIWWCNIEKHLAGYLKNFRDAIAYARAIDADDLQVG